MSEEKQKELGKILWGIADSLRGAMNADDFRDYMLSFLFLRYLSDNYIDSVKKELGNDYPKVSEEEEKTFIEIYYDTKKNEFIHSLDKKNNKDDSNIIMKVKKTPLAKWYEQNGEDVDFFEEQMRKKVHYVLKPVYLWENIYELARTHDKKLLDTLGKSFKYIENKSFSSNFNGLFSEVNLDSDKLGKNYEQRNKKLCDIIISTFAVRV